MEPTELGALVQRITDRFGHRHFCLEVTIEMIVAVVEEVEKMKKMEPSNP